MCRPDEIKTGMVKLCGSWLAWLVCLLFLVPSLLTHARATNTLLRRPLRMIKASIQMIQTAGNLCILQIWSMKKNEDASAKKKPKTSAAQIRVQKGWRFTRKTEIYAKTYLFLDLTELDLPSTMQTHFADPADLLNFTLTITPDEGGYWFLGFTWLQW